jgi:predicted transcriptional regulator
MTTMTEAIANALRVKPLIERVWTYLHDNPNKTSKDVASVLNISEQRASSSLLELLQRSMVARTKTPRHAGLDAKLEYRYTAIGKVYERKLAVRPPSKKNAVKAYHKAHPLKPAQTATVGLTPDSTKWAGALTTSAPEPKLTGDIAPTVKVDDVARIVDSFSLKTAHAVYVQLAAYFNPTAKT